VRLNDIAVYIKHALQSS
jgi:hypothetical protein